MQLFACGSGTWITYVDIIHNSADPDRPKNDKATILMDTIQLLKDLTSQVDKLKAEYATLTEESQEVIFCMCLSI